jgi:hypothetical protein
MAQCNAIFGKARDIHACINTTAHHPESCPYYTPPSPFPPSQKRTAKRGASRSRRTLRKRLLLLLLEMSMLRCITFALLVFVVLVLSGRGVVALAGCGWECGGACGR